MTEEPATAGKMMTTETKTCGVCGEQDCIATKHLNPSEVVTLTQIMAVNGDCPSQPGWTWTGGYAGAEQRVNGVLGEVCYRTNSSGERTAYVCVSGNSVLALPNTHPDYRPSAGTVWASVPEPSEIDWDHVPKQYHSRAGWRVRGR